MSTPDQNEFDYIVLEVMRGIDFAYKANDRLNDLIFSLSIYKTKSSNLEIAFNYLCKKKIISSSEKWPVSVGSDRKNIGVMFPFSIIDKDKFDNLFNELTEKYKNDSRNDSHKISITIGQSGIFLSLDKERIYKIDKNRRIIIDSLINGTKKTTTLAKEVNGKKKDIIDAISAINLRFSKNVVKKIGEKIIKSTGQGYILNNAEYDIHLE